MIMLQLIAIECYRIGEYWTAAKAFDMLEKFSIDPNPEYWEGKVNHILLHHCYINIQQYIEIEWN